MLRALIIDGAAKAEVRRVLAHAAANPTSYDELRRRAAGESLPPPGDDPAFACLMREGFKCVYTEEYQTLGRPEPVRCRHLSVSVDGSREGAMPSLYAVEMIMFEFGFHGGLRDAVIWTERLPDGGAAVNLLQSGDRGGRPMERGPS